MSDNPKRGQAQFNDSDESTRLSRRNQQIEPGPFSEINEPGPFSEFILKLPDDDTALMAEGARQMGICNSCRYCEGYCAVFPAMERRLEFHGTDLNYLANLCHNCGECYHACQYSPPHEFAINVPQLLGKIRARSYKTYAWPAPLARLFDSNGLFVAIALTLGIAAIFYLATLVSGSGAAFAQARPDGNFYAVIPHAAMAGVFGVVSLFVLAALVAGFMNFWRDSGERLAEFTRPFALMDALKDIATLKNLDGDSQVGCTYPGDQPSQARRWFHHLTFYGFMLCFAATIVGTIYHYVFGWKAPYGYFSLPVVLGTVGGIGLLIGPAGLWWLMSRRNAATANPGQSGMDVAFIALLIFTSATGLILLAVRETVWMGSALIVHLGAVMALFVSLPYGKFVHGIYRGAALVKYALERRRPGLNLGSD
jgi:citrate/tricarballylate utilization protein